MNYKLKAIKYSFYRLNKGIKILFLLSVIYLIIYEVILTQIPAPSELFYKIGKAGFVFIQILYSYVTGFIFFFINDHLKKEEKKISILRLINNSVYHLNLLTSDLLKEICKVTGTEINTKINFDQFRIKCDNINIYNTEFETWYYSKKNCRDFIIYVCAESKKSITDILTFYDLLDDKWTESLVSISDCIQKIEMLLEINKKESRLNLVSTFIWDLHIKSYKLRLLNKGLTKNYNLQEKEKIRDTLKEDRKFNFQFDDL